jgi:hypothetical protein
MILFKILTGEIFQDGTVIGHGYAGNGAGLNNPDACNQKMVGPLPTGKYEILGAVDKPESVGHFALPLAPDPGNEMFGRGSFYIHGDNPAMNETASDGCIVTAHDVRFQIAQDTDGTLTVIA